MLLSRSRPIRKNTNKDQTLRSTQLKNFDEFLINRDYIGAISLMEYERKNNEFSENVYLWLGYCHFHAGNYKKACEIYEVMLKQKNYTQNVHLYLACCFFFMGMYEEAQKEAEKVSQCPLQNRLLFHVFYKLKNETKLKLQQSLLTASVEDQLCLASIHYLRSHYQQAIDIYKKILLENPHYIALNVYLGICYYKMDYYDVSLEVLQTYLDQQSDSLIVTNLKACNHYRLYDFKAAENELKLLKTLEYNELNFAKDLIAHNNVVFQNGNAALQVFPTLIDIIPEARLNLVIYYLKKDDVDSAFSLMNKLDPQTPQEFLLKAITFCIKGTETNMKNYLEESSQYFLFVGESDAEKDTIIGRQCMASANFLNKNFKQVLVYLNSVKAFYPNDDVFNFNYGQALLMCENYEEAENYLSLVSTNGSQSGVNISLTLTYCLCLAKAYIVNKKAKLAWQFFLKNKHLSFEDSFKLLQLIANDCYEAQDYVYALKAFDELERRCNEKNILDETKNAADYANARRCSCAGVVKMFSDGNCSEKDLRKALTFLQNDSSVEAQNLNHSIQSWMFENKISI